MWGPTLYRRWPQKNRVISVQANGAAFIDSPAEIQRVLTETASYLDSIEWMTGHLRTWTL